MGHSSGQPHSRITLMSLMTTPEERLAIRVEDCKRLGIPIHDHLEISSPIMEQSSWYRPKPLVQFFMNYASMPEEPKYIKYSGQWIPLYPRPTAATIAIQEMGAPAFWTMIYTVAETARE